MIYPNFLKKNDTIGICALSAGVGDDIEGYEKSINVLKKEYKVIETASVRNNTLVSNTPKIRAQELDELVCNKEINAILSAAGGDGQMETLPYINFEHIKENPKWLIGASDPTNLLFPVTTKLDIATLYGFNSKGFDNRIDSKILLSYLKGDIYKQESYDKYIDFKDYINDLDIKRHVVYKSDKNLKVSGRIIGGCLDCIAKLVGTEYDYINDFIERYKDDGIIWYFDNFALSAFDVYLTLLQFKFAGYFKYTKAILFGRVAFESTAFNEYITSYKQAYQKALDDITYAYDLDIGHTHPCFTIINGAYAKFNCQNQKGSIEFKLI